MLLENKNSLFLNNYHALKNAEFYPNYDKNLLLGFVLKFVNNESRISQRRIIGFFIFLIKICEE